MKRRRTPAEIENDVSRIRTASKRARSLREVAKLTGLSVSKVNTSLYRYPEVRKEIMTLLKINSSLNSVPVKKVTICDTPSIIYGTSHCENSDEGIVIPEFVFKDLIQIVQGTNESTSKAKAAVEKLKSQIRVASTKGIYFPMLMPKNKVSWRAKTMVALAYHYLGNGFEVTIKTRTGEIFQLAKLQKKFKVCFVPED